MYNLTLAEARIRKDNQKVAVLALALALVRIVDISKNLLEL